MNRIINKVLLFLYGAALIAACKPMGKPTAEIFVKDKKGEAVEGAKVSVFCIPGEKSECLYKETLSEETSNAAGKTIHEFEHPGVYKVEAKKKMSGTFTFNTYRVNDTTVIDSTYTVDSSWTLYGDGFVKIPNYGEAGKADIIMADTLPVDSF
ncbi:MAG: hypothetical protein D6707_09380 [Bacteroidetes bacterium]|nr:MAG: hypothetical protein D6707_09380 [Bacteroidota bacterium]